MSEQVERIPQHHHCERCGRAFVGNGKFCSEECADASQDEVKRKLRRLMAIWVVLVLVVVVCVALVLLA